MYVQYGNAECKDVCMYSGNARRIYFVNFLRIASSKHYEDATDLGKPFQNQALSFEECEWIALHHTPIMAVRSAI
jgi:hypothetical protein